MRIVGTKYCGHDSALCLLDTDEKSIFAMSTERVTRIKHDQLDITPILEKYKFSKIDYVAHSYSDFADKAQDGELREKMIYNKEIEKALRIIIKPSYIQDLNISRIKKNMAIFRALFTDFSAVKSYYSAKFKRSLVNETPEGNKKAFVEYIKINFKKFGLRPKKVLFYEHHLCHAIPSYYLSPFNGEKVIAMTIDGQGDGFFSKIYFFEGTKSFKLIGQSSADFIGGGDRFLSIGRIYNLFTQAMDLRPNSDEGKVEALAAFGSADKDLLTLLNNATNIDKNSLSIEFDIQKIQYFYDIEWLKNQRQKIGDENFCATVQSYLEDTVVDYLNAVYKKYPINNLCLSGGVAANIIMSLQIYERTNFKNIYVLPPMGDEGLAIGSAILAAIDLDQDVAWLRDFKMPYFGDSYTREEVKLALQKFNNISFEDVEKNWPEEAAKSVAKGKICALFHGRMEFGPRALGNRSIVADPGQDNIRQRINSTVKRRPSYQPFCPSILEEDRVRLFKDSFAHKHMAIAFRMKEEFISDLPCAVHVDGTARPQFVEEEDNPNYYRYLKALKELTGYGVSLNTSFNLHGRTIVRTPHDAVVDFIDCNIDELYIEGFRVKRQ
jgi:carbamoyltransferase|tara:strand:+ start:3254 stop:5077 length:1824 start_codon:yes stop_codon:yes gene_type:complete